MPPMQKYAILVSLLCPTLLPAPASAAESTVERGKYLATIGGCNDCHTPGYFFGKPDTARTLGGSDVGFQTPGGTFVGPNLTPDQETGLGKWTSEEIVTAIRTGVKPDGRMLADIMPWRGLSHLTDSDAQAIVAYLKSLPPVKNKVPGPLGPNEKPQFPVLTIVMPQ